MKEAICEIKSSDLLKKIFSIILAIGNILNAGTQKGQADGFNLDVLSKLNSIKDNSNQKNMVTYICTLIKKDDESFESIKKMFPNLSEAAKITSADNQSLLNKLKKDLKDQIGNLTKLQTDPDEFSKKATIFVENCNKQLVIVEKNYNETILALQDLVVYFGYTQGDSKYKNPDEFFVLIDSFLNDIDKFMPKNESKKKFDRKHEVGKKIVDGPQNNMDTVLNEIKARANK
jgi:hypothetical protein